MKRVSAISALFLALLFFISLYSFFSINRRFVNFLNTNLEQQASLAGNYLENRIVKFEIDLNKLLFEYSFESIFRDEEELQKSNQSMKVFYSQYRELVDNIFIFDNKKNYYGLYINEKDHFVVDTFPKQRQERLSPRDQVEFRNGNYFYRYPYFENDEVIGNIIVEVDFEKFAAEIFGLYPTGSTISWQWILNDKGQVLYSNFDQQYAIGSLEQIADSVEWEVQGLIRHTLVDTTGRSSRVYSAYYPLNLFKQSIGIVFSTSQSQLKQYFINQNLQVIVVSFFATLIVVIFLLTTLKKRTQSQQRLKVSETVFRQIIERLPIGVMIIDMNNIIRNVNLTAQSLLMIEKDKDLTGREYNQQSLISNKYLLNEGMEYREESNYIHYEKDGIETVLFRVEKETAIGGEKLKLIALVDVSPIEKSRKQEMAANRAKSGFLASMSHEIRTPMNGILGMISHLMDTELDEDVKDVIKVMKKSSDLLMTIINDLLDFSKIEAGKMILEEIPFSVREEIGHVLDLYQPIAEEKGLKIETDIPKIVPDRLIGDPFRLRQVISNLVSNAVKFTEQGVVVIGAQLLESSNSSVQLLIFVEDSGIGIPEDKIKSIFSTYEQSSESSSRKYGGTGLGTAISKQLVELMNGEIWVESPSRISISDEFPGSRFSFTIDVYSNEPLKKQFDLSQVNSLYEIIALYLTKESVPGANSINKLLDSFGVNIATKIYQDSNIESIIHHLDVKQSQYHMVIIADKEEMDGFNLARQIHEHGLSQKFPMMMVSSNDKTGNLTRSRRMGIDYYLVEPFESKRVYDIIVGLFDNVEKHPALEKELDVLPAKLSILVVDDNLINQKVAQSIFKNIGYEITLAGNGKEAMGMIREHTYDIIFMDLHMPEMDGFEAAELIRKEGIKVPIVAMTGDESEQVVADTILAGMNEYLLKPVKIESVKRLLLKLFSTKLKSK